MPDTYVLIIRLDPEINDHTDMSCYLASQIFYQITRDGYLVHVVDSHFTQMGLIDSKRAKEMAEVY